MTRPDATTPAATPRLRDLTIERGGRTVLRDTSTDLPGPSRAHQGTAETT